MLSQKPELRDTFICLRWLAYSVGIFSNKYIDPNTNYKKEKKAKEGEIDDGIKNYVFCAWNYS